MASAAAWAVPLATSALGAYGSASGGKKAAKANKGPQIPGEFRGAVGDATNILQQGFRGGAPQYGGPFTAGLNPLQMQGMQSIQSTLGAGDQGFQSALRTIMAASEQGLNPGDLDLARRQTDPYFNLARERGVAGVREAQAQGGRFYGSGGVSAESDFLRGFEADRAAQLLPFGLQMGQFRLGAAQGLPSFLAGQMGLGGAALQAGEAERGLRQQDMNARYQEWLRTQPTAMIPLLASLMGGTPYYQNPQAPNFGQIFGAGLSGLAGSPGFLNFIQQAYGQSQTPANYGFMAGQRP